MTEQEITLVRLDLLKMLETAEPYGLKEKRLADGLHYSGYKLKEGEIKTHVRALSDAQFIRVEPDLINAADTLYFFTDRGRVYLRDRGL